MTESPEITIRRIIPNDVNRGVVKTLNSLSDMSNFDLNKATSMVKNIVDDPNYVILVAIFKDKVVGMITLFIETRLSSYKGRIAHIEDLSVDDDIQNMGIGRKIVAAALKHAVNEKCCKTILDCDDDIARYHKKNGFEKFAYSMKIYHSQ